MKRYEVVSVMNGAASRTRWQIHKAGCRDVAKRTRMGDLADIVRAKSPQALIAAELAKGLGEMGYSVADFDILPCCADADVY